jgi:hypothetical protein
MVNTDFVSKNGPKPDTFGADRRLSLPEAVTMAASEMARVPAPGTIRALMAQTGRTFNDLVGENADVADRFQTLIWIKLRRTIEGLRWEECADVEIDITEATADPTKLAASAISPPSAGSGE